MKRINLILIVASILGIFSCGNSYVLSPEQLEDVLVDLHLAEGIAIERSSDFRTNEEKLNLYTAVYEKHGIDNVKFDSTMSYYSQDLNTLVEIYEVVYNRIVELELEVQVGNYTPSTALMDKDVYARIVVEDMDILPYVQNGIWKGTHVLKFLPYDFEEGKEVSVAVDTLINRKVELRYTIESDSLSSAQCLVTMYYADDKTSIESFDLPVDSSQLVKFNWTVKDSPSKISVKFNANPMNENAELTLKDLRLYDIAAEKHSISLFN